MVLKHAEFRKLLKTKDVCRMSSLSQGSILGMVRDGRLPVVKVGPKSFRYRPEDVSRVFCVDIELIEEAD